MEDKKFLKKANDLRKKMQPFIDALYQEESEHESCGYDFGCIVESVTLWEKFEELFKQQLLTIIGELEDIEALEHMLKHRGVPDIVRDRSRSSARAINSFKISLREKAAKL